MRYSMPIHRERLLLNVIEIDRKSKIVKHIKYNTA